MGEILKFEADRRAINITINSLDTELTKEGRSELYCGFGELYGEGIMRLERAENHDAVRAAVEPYPQYRQLFQEATYSQEKSLEDCFFEYEVRTLCFLSVSTQLLSAFFRMRFVVCLG
jgi:V-type H+-transporting ATPase subunit d